MHEDLYTQDEECDVEWMKYDFDTRDMLVKRKTDGKVHVYLGVSIGKWTMIKHNLLKKKYDTLYWLINIS